MTVASWLNDWLLLRSAELRPRTREQYQDLINRIINPVIGSLEVSALAPDDVRHLLASIAAEGHSRTAELCFVLLKAAFRDFDGPSPMRTVRRPAHRQQSPAPWDDSQAAAYLAALADHPHGLALSLALILGLRRGEICGLRWADIDFDAGVLHVRNQRVRLATGEIIDAPPKSATSDRELPLPAVLLSQLRAARGHPSAYVCPLTPSGLNTAHRKLVARLGLPHIPLHGLRHTMATACIRHGGDMRALQSVLGHSSYAVTADRYTHPDRSMLLSAIDAGPALCYTVIRR